MSKVSVFYGGKNIRVTLLDTDVKGRPWEGIGYRSARARLKKKDVDGYVHWLGGRWCFTPGGIRR